jgi:hypothetical protein
VRQLNGVSPSRASLPELTRDARLTRGSEICYDTYSRGHFGGWQK